MQSNNIGSPTEMRTRIVTLEDQVRALVSAEFPGVLNGPLAVAIASFVAVDEADRAVRFADLQARAEAKLVRADAREHADSCIFACCGWTVETLGHNIECSFGNELDADECDAIARQALGR